MNKTEQFHNISEQEPSYEDQYQNWVSYLTFGRNSPQLTQSEKMRISLAEFLYKLQKEESRHLYHLTLTYKPRPEYEQFPTKVDKNFILFYTRYLLPNVMGTKNYHFMCHKLLQPKVIAFLDEHRHDKFTKAGCPSRLHHHAIVAVLPIHKEFMDQLIGVNTFPILSEDESPIMTSDLKSCSPMRVLYSSKKMHKFPDFLSFPDNMKRTHVKHRMTQHTKKSDLRLKKIYENFPDTARSKFGSSNLSNKFLPT